MGTNPSVFVKVVLFGNEIKDASGKVCPSRGCYSISNQCETHETGLGRVLDDVKELLDASHSDQSQQSEEGEVLCDMVVL